MFCAGDRIGIGVSGGADSIALLLLLHELKPELPLHLLVLHFNHELRGADSDADQALVAHLAAQLGIECITARRNVRQQARSARLNLEDAARRLRYSFFADVAASKRLQRVAVAHTADDQAETVLARIVRGSGPPGLASIYPVKGTIVRPLLEIRRAELRAYLSSRGQHWREDASNQDTARLRAFLRHNVLPLLERSLQPAIVPHLARLAALAREDESFWCALLAERLSSLTRAENGRIGIPRRDLLFPLGATLGSSGSAEGENPQLALARRLVRAMVAALPGTPRQLTAAHVNQVLRLASESTSGRRIHLPRASAERCFDWIWFEAAPPAPNETPSPLHPSKFSAEATAFSHMIEWDANRAETAIVVPEIRTRIRLKVIDWFHNARETSFGPAIDRELLRPPLLLRSWRPGDSFRPQGRRRPLKLKQFLRESRVARRDRPAWPVLTSGGALVWARGLPVAADFSPGEMTRAAVIISEEPV